MNSVQQPWLLGGNQVKQFGPLSGDRIFADSPYFYGCFIGDDGDTITVSGFDEGVLFIKEAAPGVTLTVQGGDMQLTAGDSADFSGISALDLCVKGGEVLILVAGLKGHAGKAVSLNFTKSGDHYKVTKPWGHELWINGDHPKYVLKEIAIKAGTKTSLQYHNFKEETNVLFEGEAALVYKENADVENDNVTSSDLGKQILAPVSSIHVTPQVLHRLHAVTNVLLYEVSTPYLDDVIRVSDDTGRSDGRIFAEHGSKV